jgi:hypothetical protein
MSMPCQATPAKQWRGHDWGLRDYGLRGSGSAGPAAVNVDELVARAAESSASPAHRAWLDGLGVRT